MKSFVRPFFYSNHSCSMLSNSRRSGQKPKWYLAAAVVSAPLLTSDTFTQQSTPAPQRYTNTRGGRELAFDELKAFLGSRFSRDAADCEQRGLELSGYAPRADPEAVCWPESTEEVSHILTICNRHAVPVVPYAGGTSVEGHTSAVCGGVSLELSLMDKILQINKDDEDIVVQSGIGWMQLNEEIQPLGFFISADPGPGACVGGMCATGCSGTNAVRYGTMKDQVLNITAVLADGTIIKTRRRPRKSSAGYDLTRLLVGSEGTLAIVTEVTLKMRAIPPSTEIAFVTFSDVHSATTAVTEILQAGIQVGAVEFCDEVMVDAMNKYSNLELPTNKQLLLFKFTGRTSIHTSEDINDAARICSKHTKDQFVWCPTSEEKEKLWTARKHAFWAAQSQRPDKRLMATDVAVPISRLADLITRTKEEIKKSEIYGPIVGHVGDANFHVCLMVDPNNSEEMDEAHRLNEFMVYMAIEMDGTCTGEHGVGTGKKKYLPAELGLGTVHMMRRIKQSLDPNNILNPGKIF